MTTALFMLSFLTACATLFLFHSSFSFSLLLVYAFTPSLHSASSFFFTCATFFPFRFCGSLFVTAVSFSSFIQTGLSLSLCFTLL
ncbi:hypothetical protein BDB00DRAFT_853056, partial [Zychaea mexicana]|uniref:uncharacterized protein n=1 Tax=Zychaea mexicana TaxID=64656 RepID=UPI0022FDF5C3